MLERIGKSMESALVEKSRPTTIYSPSISIKIVRARFRLIERKAENGSARRPPQRKKSRESETARALIVSQTSCRSSPLLRAKTSLISPVCYLPSLREPVEPECSTISLFLFIIKRSTDRRFPRRPTISIPRSPRVVIYRDSAWKAPTRSFRWILKDRQT